MTALISDSPDLGHELVGRRGGTPDPLPRLMLQLLDKIGARDPDHVGQGLHREPP
jgi:hypothetical protein